ncbi:MAG TPA: TonB family protein [Pyrinomonadaceae bacterium]|nr:TonB family protein [Pyrinomonadaceae bacterium]
MAFTGQLNDLALSELIEFFCNQRKTGRLKVDYALAPGVFFIKDGELVDAKVGALNGTDAVFFALTLPSASFDFSAGMQSSRRTITDSWASVVLEGLRRIDEGIMPDASQAFASEEEIDEATIEYLNCIETAKEGATKDATKDAPKDASTNGSKTTADDSFSLPLAQTLEATHDRRGKSKLVVAGIAAALVIACLVAAVPLSKRFKRSSTTANAASAPAAAQTTNAADASAPSGDSASTTTAATDPNADANATSTAAAAEEEAARVARREREARLERQRKLQEAKRAEAAQASTDAAAPEAAPKPAVTGPKSVRVQITYDEAGRVTQTSVVGSSPGAEAYASTAVRVARGRRFPAGKPGSTVVTIPIN